MNVNKKGFTLVELLVAMAIMGLLLVMAFPIIRSIRTNNRDKNFDSFGDAVISAAKLYVDSYGDDLFDLDRINEPVVLSVVDIRSKGLLKNKGIMGSDCVSESSVVIARYKDDYSYCLHLVCKNGEDRLYEKRDTRGICADLKLSKVLYKYRSFSSSRDVIIGDTRYKVLDIKDIPFDFKPEKDVLINWKVDGSSVSTINSGEFLPAIQNEVTLTAHTRRYRFNVVYKKGLGEGVMEDKKDCELYGPACILGPNKFTKEGYTFTEWKHDATHSYKDNTDLNDATNKNTTFNLINKDHEDFNVTAQFRKNEVRIHYNTNGGGLAPLHDNNFTLSGNTIKYNNKEVIQVVKYGEALGSNGLVNWNNSSALNLRKVGYIVKAGYEWNTRPDGKGVTFNQDTAYTAAQLCPDINKGDCDITLYPIWVRNFSCGNVGSTIRYMGYNWYVNKNDGTYCDLSLMGTVGSGVSYNNNSKVIDYIKGYSNGTDTLLEEKNAGLVDRINTDSGLGNASSIAGQWWAGDRSVYFGTPITTYKRKQCDWYFHGWGSSRDNVAKNYLCLGYETKKVYKETQIFANNQTSHVYSDTSHTSGTNTSTKVSHTVNEFTHDHDGRNTVFFKRKVYNMRTNGTWGAITLARADANGTDNVHGCLEHYNDWGDTHCPDAQSTTEATGYKIHACGGDVKDDIKTGNWYFAGGTNYIYNKNNVKRELDVDSDHSNSGNAPGFDCKVVKYYEVSGTTTASFSFRPHVRVKM